MKIAKRIAVYLFIDISLSLFFAAIASIQDLIVENYPAIPYWTMPVLAAIIVLIIGVFVWKKFEDTEMLRNEFIAIVTHKLRTPLTHIKWAAEELDKKDIDDEARQNLNSIQEASFKLVELTGTLIKVTNESDKGSSDIVQKTILAEIINEILPGYKTQSEKRKIEFTANIDGTATSKIDRERFKAVMQIIIDNALSYTPDGGKVILSTKIIGKSVHIDCKDTGIGIAKNDLAHLFGKFYRSKDAQKADSGGLGIGLYLSRDIIRRQGGDIQIASEGSGHGTTVTVILPLV